MKPLLLTASLGAMLCGCGPAEKEHEVDRVGFVTEEMRRFTITKETTPIGWPNLYLIRDWTNHNDILVIEAAGDHSLSAVKLEVPQ